MKRGNVTACDLIMYLRRPQVYDSVRIKISAKLFEMRLNKVVF